MKYRIIYEIEANPKNEKEFFESGLEGLAHILKEDIEENCLSYLNRDDDDKHVSVDIDCIRVKTN